MRSIFIWVLSKEESNSSAIASWARRRHGGFKRESARSRCQTFTQGVTFPGQNAEASDPVRKAEPAQKSKAQTAPMNTSETVVAPRVAKSLPTSPPGCSQPVNAAKRTLFKQGASEVYLGSGETKDVPCLTGKREDCRLVRHHVQGHGPLLAMTVRYCRRRPWPINDEVVPVDPKYWQVKRTCCQEISSLKSVPAHIGLPLRSLAVRISS